MVSPWIDLLTPLALTVGVVVALGALLVALLPRYRWVVAGLLLIIVTPIMLVGFLPNGQWGISDWDYYFSYHEVVRDLTLTYGTVPTWNPYICGGTTAVGDPEFPFFTPTFLLELLYGVPFGLRLAAMVTTAIGALGMLALAHRLKLSALAGLLAALAFSFGSVTILELVEGHPNVFAVMYIPWIFWSWLAAYQSSNGNRRHSRLWSLLTGVLLAATFLQGGIYLLMYTAGAFIFLLAVVRRRVDALRVTVTAGVWGLSLAALKLVPVLLWLTQFQDQSYASSASTLTSLPEIFLGRYLHGSEVIPNQGSGWHEYGAYVGPLVLALAALALTRIKRSRVIKLLLVAGLIAIAISSSGPLLKPLFDQASFLPRSNVSRLVLFTVLPLALLAGIGLDRLRQLLASVISPKYKLNVVIPSIVAVIALGVVATDLGSLTQPLSEQAFTVLPTVSATTAQEPLQHTFARYEIRDEDGVDHSRAYAATLANYGTQAYCTVLGAPPSVATVEQTEEPQALVRTRSPDGTATLLRWEPDKIVAQVASVESTDVMVNANYARGWEVNGNPAIEIKNQLAITIPAGSHTLTFTYAPPGFVFGQMVTLLALLLAVGLLIYPRISNLGK
ncbi:hypothetical protein CL628_00500 [bacterium]|nr:hypothetical protein [bacterium]